MYYLPTSCLVLFFLFSFFHPFPCDSSNHELGLCEAQFQCGNITAGFPFSGGNRPQICGHPLLELHCVNNITSIIMLSQFFTVLHLDQTSNTLRLASAELEGPFCNATITSTTLPSEIFELSPTYKSLTVFYLCDAKLSYRSSYTCPGRGLVTVPQNLDYKNSCQGSFIINVPKSFTPEEKELNMTHLESALREGFEVKVKIDEESCQKCSSSHGTCTFENTTQICCKEASSSRCNNKLLSIDDSNHEELHIRCSTPFSCGDQRGLLYPFWILGREECGHPDFELDCSRGFAEVSIYSVKFRILEANYDSGIIKLVRVDYINSVCPLNPPNVPFNENVLPFAPETETLTIFYSCGQDFSQYVSTNVKDLDCEDDDTRNYYVTRNLSSPPVQGIRGLLDELRGSFNRNVSIPASKTALSTLESDASTDNLKKALEDGFELGVNLDCRKCMDSRGACGYNHTQPSVGFVCYSRNTDAGLSTGAKAGIGAASALMGVIFIAAGLFCVIRYQKKTSDYLRQENLKALDPLKHYSYSQLKRMTKSFAEVVGKGGFGTVYRGTLSDGSSVAVKILKDSKGNGEDFINEVASMSKTSHVNIVSLLGFCSEGSKRAIVYEYLENGSLDQFILSNTSMNVDWMALYGIALGVARGLEYLHHGCKIKIVHFDIKPQNILLDDNLCPKVSDFGLAKLCEKKESILSLLDTRGTIGYIAPEVFSRMYGRVSHKSDVYSYGMLLLEMIGTRNKETFDQNSASNTSSMYFPEWIYKDLRKGDIGRLFENGISSEEEEVAKKMTLVGLWCIQPFPSDRPAMNRVVEMMEGNVEAIEVPPTPVSQDLPMPLMESSTFSEDISVSTEEV